MNTGTLKGLKGLLKRTEVLLAEAADRFSQEAVSPSKKPARRRPATRAHAEPWANIKAKTCYEHEEALNGLYRTLLARAIRNEPLRLHRGELRTVARAWKFIRSISDVEVLAAHAKKRTGTPLVTVMRENNRDQTFRAIGQQLLETVGEFASR